MAKCNVRLAAYLLISAVKINARKKTKSKFFFVCFKKSKLEATSRDREA